jgi:hypothetical protein
MAGCIVEKPALLKAHTWQQHGMECGGPMTHAHPPTTTHTHTPTHITDAVTAPTAQPAPRPPTCIARKSSCRFWSLFFRMFSSMVCSLAGEGGGGRGGAE